MYGCTKLTLFLFTLLSAVIAAEPPFIPLSRILVPGPQSILPIPVDVKQADKAVPDVRCTSTSGLDANSNKLYFGCTCRERYGDAEFAVAKFISDVSPKIFDRNIVINLRDCWGLKLHVNENDLYNPNSPNFRPDLYVSQINLENIVEIHLNGSSDVLHNSSESIDRVRLSPSVPISVTLYDVERVYIHDDVDIDLLKSENPGTVLNVGSVNLTTSKLKVRGFQSENILLSGSSLYTNQNGEFSHVLLSIEKYISSKSALLSCVLVGCASIVAIGIGAAAYAIFKRHQYLIQAVIYSSFDSIKRKKKPKPESPDHLTTTSVNFFPKYSLVMKGGLKNSNETDNKIIDQMPEKLSVRSKLSRISSLSSSGGKKKSSKEKDGQSSQKLENINRNHENVSITPDLKGKEMEEKHNSFYYQTDTSGSSKSDLTIARNIKTEAEIHNNASQSSNTQTREKSLISSSDLLKTSRVPSRIGIYTTPDLQSKSGSTAIQILHSASPQPLLESERKYSFRLIREKCRNLINFHPINTKL